MSTRLGSTRYRVWASARLVGEVGDRRSIFTLTMSRKKDAGGFEVVRVAEDLERGEMRDLREEWIDECKALHEQETGERSVDYAKALKEKVSFTKAKKSDKPVRHEDDSEQGSLFG